MKALDNSSPYFINWSWRNKNIYASVDRWAVLPLRSKINPDDDLENGTGFCGVRSDLG